MSAGTETAEVTVEPEQESARGEAAFEEIATRAYEIHASGEGGDALENWLRAERELSSELEAE